MFHTLSHTLLNTRLPQIAAHTTRLLDLSPNGVPAAPTCPEPWREREGSLSSRFSFVSTPLCVCGLDDARQALHGLHLVPLSGRGIVQRDPTALPGPLDDQSPPVGLPELAPLPLKELDDRLFVLRQQLPQPPVYNASWRVHADAVAVRFKCHSPPPEIGQQAARPHRMNLSRSEEPCEPSSRPSRVSPSDFPTPSALPPSPCTSTGRSGRPGRSFPSIFFKLFLRVRLPPGERSSPYSMPASRSEGAIHFMRLLKELGAEGQALERRTSSSTSSAMAA